MQVQSYLFFEGRCEEAVEFYRKALGAKVLFLMRYKDSPDLAALPPGTSGEKVMHMSFRIGDTTVLASDGHSSRPANFQGFALSLTTQDEPEAQKMFDALTQGGQVRMPMGKTFFSPRFGMVTDRFGVLWMVYVTS